ncbi:hypothetical protein BKA93DRAFT_768357 [Sparassis latifolia]
MHFAQLAGISTLRTFSVALPMPCCEDICIHLSTAPSSLRDSSVLTFDRCSPITEKIGLKSCLGAEPETSRLLRGQTTAPTLRHQTIRRYQRDTRRR